MRLKPKYCSKCGTAVDLRTVAGRERAVCPTCDSVLYQNPLPVAAAVVLNERREVLLVRRAHDPHKGKWCLPMGFAELDETIGDAALRELKEEAGIDGRVLRLLDADSYPSGHYGDLLIVTFEIEKTGGAEQAGDDADDVRYFPIGRHPRLAFSSNEKALRACAATHLEGWEIHDSFVTLETDEEKPLLSDELIEVIESRGHAIAQAWLADVQTSPTTPSYRHVAADQLLERATTTIAHFGRWFKGDTSADEVRAHYRDLARLRKTQGFSLSELLSSLTLLKKHVWACIYSHGAWERPIDVYRVLELNRLMAVFFDKAVYHTARGFDHDDEPASSTPTTQNPPPSQGGAGGG